MTIEHHHHTPHVPLDARDPSTVRAAILARSSDLGAKPKDMAEQVKQCQEFIASMGWPAPPPDRIFTEAKSGVRNVDRPVIDAVLALAQAGAIDVVVCREWERVARVKGRRYRIVETARDYGVEFRFANLAQDRGRMADTLETRTYRDVLEELGEAERNKIVERLSPGKRRRQVEGLPHGGRGGARYGYRPGERRVVHGRQAGCLTWEVDEDEAKVVRSLFDTIDAKDPADLSLRRLAADLDRRGVRTATGRGHWDATYLRNLLTSPIYAGAGYNGRYSLEWQKARTADGRVREVRRIRDLARDQTAPRYPLADGAVPPIVTRAQFDRVQVKLHEASVLRNRGGARRTDLDAMTLLNGGFIRCAECKGQMTRYWQRNVKRPYYCCAKNAARPGINHQNHNIAAPYVDALVLETLADALTGPEDLLRIADLAAETAAHVEQAVARATAEQAVIDARLREIAAEQENLATAIDALAHVGGMGGEVARIRRRLASLDEEQTALTSQHVELRMPVAESRARYLRMLFTVRDFIFDEANDGTPLHIGPKMTVAQASALLNTTDPASLNLLITEGKPLVYETPDGLAHDREQDTVVTADILLTLLKQLPREQLRTVFRFLGLTVEVARPRTRAEWATLGKTPVDERVRVFLYDRALVLDPRLRRTRPMPRRA